MITLSWTQEMDLDLNDIERNVKGLVNFSVRSWPQQEYSRTDTTLRYKTLRKNAKKHKDVLRKRKNVDSQLFDARMSSRSKTRSKTKTGRLSPILTTQIW